MAYSELIKNFEHIRDYMREFYVYGFKSRDEFDIKSGRSYDNERRRIESYLGDYMSFRQTASGKTLFLSIDSRSTSHNPLYKAFKSKSFTGGDITLHFILFDILYSPEIRLTLSEITKKIDREYLSRFREPMLFDESTVRKKLKEYIELGLIAAEKHGKQMLYSRKQAFDLNGWEDALNFFSEAGFDGVIGSYLLDKIECDHEHFAFKHHYITHAMESEILCELFLAISEKRFVTIQTASRVSEETVFHVIPLKIYISVQSGRRYLMAYSYRYHQMKSYRLDSILKVQIGEAAEDFDSYRAMLNQMQPHMWGVISRKDQFKFEHVEFTVRFDDNEEYIYQRLEREKRCGTVTRIDKNTARFSADVYDTWELVPWIRTFICRITSMNFSNRTVENQFIKDVEDMHYLYSGGSLVESVPNTPAVYLKKSGERLHANPDMEKGMTRQKTNDTIYHEIYGCYYNCVAKILSQAVDGVLTEESMNRIIRENCFSESFLTVLPALKKHRWQLLCDNLSTPIQHTPTMPLTTLQLRWLKAISLDPRIKLFRVNFDGLENIKPLFTPDDYVVFDQYSDGDPFEDETYIGNFHTIIDAMHQKRKLRIQYTARNGKRFTIHCIPKKLEYSEKDNKFRLIAAGSSYAGIINLAKITACELTENFSAFPQLCEIKKEHITFELVDKRNALDRVMLHFAHFEKQAERLTQNRYRVTVYYDKDEEIELVIRVLSFGPMVKVIEPSRFAELIKYRLNRQKTLWEKAVL